MEQEPHGRSRESGEHVISDIVVRGGGLTRHGLLRYHNAILKKDNAILIFFVHYFEMDILYVSKETVLTE